MVLVLAGRSSSLSLVSGLAKHSLHPTKPKQLDFHNSAQVFWSLCLCTNTIRDHHQHLSHHQTNNAKILFVDSTSNQRLVVHKVANEFRWYLLLLPSSPCAYCSRCSICILSKLRMLVQVFCIQWGEIKNYCPIDDLSSYLSSYSFEWGSSVL
jgi:hypothetical protein